MAEPGLSSGSRHHPATDDAASCNKKTADDTDSIRETTAGETVHVIDRAAERALCRKFDFRLLPMLATMVCLIISLVFERIEGEGMTPTRVKMPHSNRLMQKIVLMSD